MSTQSLVESFYARIWNAGDEHVDDLLAEDFTFRGSLGTEAHGRAEFLQYVRSVRGSLANYHCEILECVTEFPRAFAQMLFSGIHSASFRGYAPTGKPVQWHGAALFTFRHGLISKLWVLGDLAGLDQVLRSNAVW
jgi:predicted ester cyclase